MARAFLEIRIPDKSLFTFRVSVVDGEDGFTARMTFTHPDGKRETFNDAELRRGRQRTLRSPAAAPRTYKGRLTLSFSRKSHVRIRMKVKENGNVRTYDEKVKGDSSSRVDRTPITLTMKAISS